MKKQGFTIVELLIEIVVIGVLAAISAVAYTGISKRADDAARISESEQIKKKIRLREAATGVPTPTTAESATKATFLTAYDMTPLSERIIYDECYTGCNKKQIYLTADNEVITWWYWSNARNSWVQKKIYYYGNHSNEYEELTDSPYHHYT